MRKVLTVIGTRPQFIKATSVSRALRFKPCIDEILVHTGQHYDANLSGIFFRELDIPEPDYHLGIGSAPHGAQTGQMLEAIEAVLQNIQPDIVIVYGDTNSTLAGALAATKLHIPVAHVEAGLRSFNRLMPEEINRVLTDHVSDYLFAPTDIAVQNLRQEGISEAQVFQVGDVMYDVALYFSHKAETHSQIMANLQLSPQQFLLSTIHRAESTNDSSRLRSIFGGLIAISQIMPVILPLHPRTRNALKQADLLEKACTHLTILEPIGYLDMVMLEKHARLIVTDSGGIQKEAFFHQTPCVVLRGETEWIELVRLGYNKLVPPTSIEAIAAGIQDHLTTDYQLLPRAEIYGDGHTSEQIIDYLYKVVA